MVDYGDCLLDYRQPPEDAGHRSSARRRSSSKSGAFLLSLGGDHFVTWPLLKAHAAMHGPLALVQFDAHQDTWPDDGKRIDHGSFVGARRASEGIIDPDRSIQIGIRTHAPDDCGIKILYGYEVEEMRASDIAYAIVERTGGKKTYITFDIDCLDPAYAPGTGTPVAGGPSSAKILSVLRQLGQIDIVGADVVEVAPAYDHADITAIAGVDGRDAVSRPAGRAKGAAEAANWRSPRRESRQAAYSLELHGISTDHETENLHRRRTRHDRPADPRAACRRATISRSSRSRPSGARTRRRAPISSMPPTSPSSACPTTRRRRAWR